MVAMPYILVDMVLNILSLIFFCITSAALLSRYTSANRYLPAQLRNQKTLAFVAQGLVLSVLSIAVVLVSARVRNVSYILSPFIFELFFCLGVINSVVLSYQFLDRRYLLNTPKVQRRLLIAIISVVMTSVPVIAVVTAVVGLFIIK